MLDDSQDPHRPHKMNRRNQVIQYDEVGDRAGVVGRERRAAMKKKRMKPTGSHLSFNRGMFFKSLAPSAPSLTHPLTIVSMISTMPNGLRSHFSTTASTRSIHIETPLRLRTPPMAMRETASILKRSYGRLSNTCPVGSLWQEAFTTSGYVSETPKRGYHRRSRCRHLLSLRISTYVYTSTRQCSYHPPSGWPHASPSSSNSRWPRSIAAAKYSLAVSPKSTGLDNLVKAYKSRGR
ncbi:hypothetical protein L202_05887 [Cryptococcus amylolentus CBS 6039]|uniref:Uncharacterized protein n=1 Tax=Cryptococcus amylolentus CBS 6039 TaxID=1295533 RepID=A0A1E3HKB9_9TREE|nr:hypothetical protein L202_05887 [Cryptococcus amylolentus CBS 6039]ODN75901.1 hypothetical protein L202_05887 [Cryptococcus amylolentus CBS 6039]